jgi:hypothetical protein
VKERAIVPMAVLAELIEEWLLANQMVASGGGFQPDVDQSGGQVAELCKRVGISQRRLYTIRRGFEGTRKHVTLQVADRLVCAMDKTEEWHLRLAPYYADGAAIVVCSGCGVPNDEFSDDCTTCYSRQAARAFRRRRLAKRGPALDGPASLNPKPSSRGMRASTPSRAGEGRGGATSHREVTSR